MSNSCVKVSIIIPIYNGEKVLERCINSILGQTYRNFEIILVNDGSTDSSETICKKYVEQDQRVRLITKEQEGVSVTRNRGIKEATGQYIQFVDCDDYLASDYVETMVLTMEQKQADLVIAGYTRRRNGQVVEKMPTPAFYSTKQEFSKDFFELYNHWYLNTPWNKLFRRACVKEYFPSDRSLGEDLLFNLSYIRAVERIAVITCVGYQYCIENVHSLGIQFRADKFANSMDLHQQVLAFASGELNLIHEKEWKDVTFLKEIRFSITNLVKSNQVSKAKKKDYIHSWCAEEEVKQAYKRCDKLEIKDWVLKQLIVRGCIRCIYPLVWLLK